MKAFLTRWLTTTIAVLAAAQILPGIHYESPVSLLLAALLLGIVNALVRPLVLLLSLPLILATFGFFILVVNALMFRFVAVLVPGFHVDSFGSAFFGSIVISIVGWIVGSFFKENKPRIYRMPPGSPPTAPEPEIKQANARVIDEDESR